jgi:hypothetical protein
VRTKVIKISPEKFKALTESLAIFNERMDRKQELELEIVALAEKHARLEKTIKAEISEGVYKATILTDDGHALLVDEFSK